MTICTEEPKPPGILSFGNHLSGKGKSSFQTDNECGGATILKNRTSRMGTCNQRAPTDGFAEQNGRDAERADIKSKNVFDKQTAT